MSEQLLMGRRNSANARRERSWGNAIKKNCIIHATMLQ
jgi:hypothetical protein